MEESGLLPVYAALLAHRMSPARSCLQEDVRAGQMGKLNLPRAAVTDVALDQGQWPGSSPNSKKCCSRRSELRVMRVSVREFAQTMLLEPFDFCRHVGRAADAVGRIAACQSPHVVIRL